MADEVKETVETTEAPAAEEKKAKKVNVNIDTEKLKGQALGIMGKVKDTVYYPNEEASAIYDKLFEEYKETCLQQEKLSSIVNNIVHLQPLFESLQTDFNNLVNSLANSVAKYTSPEYPHAGMIRGQI